MSSVEAVAPGVAPGLTVGGAGLSSTVKGCFEWLLHLYLAYPLVKWQMNSQSTQNQLHRKMCLGNCPKQHHATTPNASRQSCGPRTRDPQGARESSNLPRSQISEAQSGRILFLPCSTAHPAWPMLCPGTSDRSSSKPFVWPQVHLDCTH